LRHFLIEKIIIIAKGKVQKKREPHKKTREEQKAEGAKKRRIKKKKFRSACILLSRCAKLFCCLLELGPE